MCGKRVEEARTLCTCVRGEESKGGRDEGASDEEREERRGNEPKRGVLDGSNRTKRQAHKNKKKESHSVLRTVLPGCALCCAAMLSKMYYTTYVHPVCLEPAVSTPLSASTPLGSSQATSAFPELGPFKFPLTPFPSSYHSPSFLAMVNFFSSSSYLWLFKHFLTACCLADNDIFGHAYSTLYTIAGSVLKPSSHTSIPVQSVVHRNRSALFGGSFLRLRLRCFLPSAARWTIVDSAIPSRVIRRKALFMDIDRNRVNFYYFVLWLGLV